MHFSYEPKCVRAEARLRPVRIEALIAPRYISSSVPSTWKKVYTDTLSILSRLPFTSCKLSDFAAILYLSLAIPLTPSLTNNALHNSRSTQIQSISCNLIPIVWCSAAAADFSTFSNKLQTNRFNAMNPRHKDSMWHPPSRKTLYKSISSEFGLCKCIRANISDGTKLEVLFFPF